MLILHVTSSRFCLYLLIFITLPTHFHTHIHSTHTQAYIDDQHTRGMATTRQRSLVGRGGVKAFVRHKFLPHKIKKDRKPNISNPKKYFEHIELPAKLLDYFLRSNKSNINHCKIAPVFRNSQKSSYNHSNECAAA